MNSDKITKPVTKILPQQKKVSAVSKTLPAVSNSPLLSNELLSNEFNDLNSFSTERVGVKQLVGVELLGKQTIGAKFNSFFFGKESTYTLLQKKYKEFLAGNQKLKPECISLAKKWLQDHGSSKDPNDILKHKSIDALLNSLSNNQDNQEAEKKIEPSVNPEPLPSPFIIKESEENPVVEQKNEISSNINEVEILHDKYKEVKKIASSPSELYMIFNKLSDFVKSLKNWEQNFGNPKNPKFESEKLMINQFRLILLDSYTYESDIISGTITELNEEKLLDKEFHANAMSANLNFLSRAVNLNIKNLKINQNGFAFAEAEILYDESIGFSEIFSIDKPSLKVSSSESGYNITATGSLSIKLGDGITASGDVEIGYDTNKRAFEKPKVTNGKFAYDKVLNIGEVISANELKGTLSFTDGNYQMEGSGDLAVNILGATATGKVLVAYDKGFKVKSITNTKFEASIFDGVASIEGSGISLSGEGLTMASSKITIKLPSGDAVMNVESVSVNKKGVTFKEAVIENSQSIGFSEIFSIDKPSLKVSSSESGYNITATGSLSIKLGDGITASGDVEIGYDTNKRAFEKPKVTNGKFAYDKVLNIGEVISANELKGTLSFTDGNYQMEGSGDLAVNILGATATGKVLVAYDKGFKVKSITDGVVSASVLNNFGNFEGRGITYDENGLQISNSTMTLSLGGFIPGANEIKANAKGIKYINESFDWDLINLQIDKKYSLGGLEFSIEGANLYGKSKNYIIEIVNAGAEVSINDYLNAKGKANFDWDILNRKAPEITSSTLNFLVSSPLIPKDIIPGILPIDYAFIFPFAAGPVPMEAGFSFNVDANASVKIGGEMNYNNNAYDFKVDAEGMGFLTLGIGVTLSVGSSFLISLGGFIKGESNAALKANLGIKGKADKKETGFDFSDLTLDYKMGADVKAQIKAGIEARALIIFKKTLYSVVIKEWNLGHTEKSGEMNLLSKTNKGGTSKGILLKGNTILNDPDAEAKSLPFIEKMNAIEALIKNTRELPEGEKTVENLLKAKTEVLNKLQESIDVTIQDEHFKKLIIRLNHYITKLEEIDRKYTEWTIRQETKKLEPNKFSDNFKVSHWRKSRQEYYTAKLAVGEIKHKQYLERNIGKKNNVKIKYDVYQNQIDESKLMIINIDYLLNPLNEVEDISAEINKKETFDATMEDLKVEINDIEIAERAQSGLDNAYEAHLNSDEDTDADLVK